MVNEGLIVILTSNNEELSGESVWAFVRFNSFFSWKFFCSREAYFRKRSIVNHSYRIHEKYDLVEPWGKFKFISFSLKIYVWKKFCHLKYCGFFLYKFKIFLIYNYFEKFVIFSFVFSLFINWTFHLFVLSLIDGIWS